MLLRSLAAALLAVSVANAAPHNAPFPKQRRAPVVKRGSSGVDGTSVIGFWGQSYLDLSDVCDNGSWDIVIMSFVTSMNPPKLNLGKDTGAASEAQAAKEESDGWGLFDGTVAAGGGSKPSIADQIAACQAQGIKVLLALGGDSRFSNATFASADEAEAAAGSLWDLFLGGTGATALRPFGANVTLDGIDIDNESGDGSYYVDFVRALRAKMGSGNGTTTTDEQASSSSSSSSSPRQYYIGADPMCAESGAHTADDASTSVPDSILPYLDWVNVQFYNAGTRGVGGSDFEDAMRTWAAKLQNVSGDSRPALVLGVPGAEGAAEAGADIMTPDEIASRIADVQGWDIDGFGGVGVWDAGYAMQNNSGFVEAVKASLTGAAGAGSNSTSASKKRRV